MGGLDAVEAILWGGLSGGTDVDGSNGCKRKTETVPAQGIHSYCLDEFLGNEVGYWMDLLGWLVEGVEFDGLNDDELKLLFGVAQALHSRSELDVIVRVDGGTDEDDFVIALLEYLMVAGDVF